MATITEAGAVPATPASLLAAEIANATALAPGLTASLPGSLIEDLASTATGALIVQDQTFVDLINSVSPYNANASMLYQLGAVYGVAQGQGSNTSVYVIFTGSVGFVINSGFIVSDGTNQYSVQDGGIIGTSGTSASLYCLAINQGTWSVPSGTVTQIITSLPSLVALSCTNLSAGLPGLSSQPIESYQAQVIQAGQATAQGVPQFLKTQLNNVSGVQSNLVSVRQQGSQWEIICGGGDPYQVANAIYMGVPDTSNIIGSQLLVSAITNSYPAVVTTNLNHGYATGQVINIAGEVGMTGINGIPYIAIVLSNTTFSLNVAISSMVLATGTVTVTTANPHGLPTGTITGAIYGVTPAAYNGTYTFTRTGTNTFTYPLSGSPGAVTVQGYTGFDSALSGSYASGGLITPNLRNVTVSINSYPDTYAITFVKPPVQQATVALTWNTISSNYVSSTAISSLGVPALVAYINSIAVGQPINIFDMQTVFQNAVSGIIAVNLISKMLFVVTINGVSTLPATNTGVIYGDPESYYNTTNALITITQG